MRDNLKSTESICLTKPWSGSNANMHEEPTFGNMLGAARGCLLYWLTIAAQPACLDSATAT